MDFQDAMRAMVASSGQSLRAASVASGRTPGWLTSTLTRGSAPTVTVAADLARACGYALAYVPVGQVPDAALVIDPPR